MVEHLLMSPFLAAATAPTSLSSHFRLLDWVVLIGYLALVSVLGVLLAGKQTDMEDFFRGGNKLPWYAVAGSTIATIISAVTFVGVPAVAYAQGGNFTYLQFGLIAGLLSRLFVSFVLVPAYYKHKVYSPYDYMGVQLGEAARSVTTILFSVLGLLAQAARVYLTAVILELILKDQLTAFDDATGISPLVASIALVGIISIIWTMLGGIATVIWTDAMLFLVFLGGGLIALFVIANALPGGFGQIFSQGWEAGKFDLWNLTGSTEGVEWASALGRAFAEPYTIWAAIFAVTFGNIGAYGTDQLIAQRIFTCRNQKEAKLAMMASYAGELIVALMLLVGVGLWAYYKTFPEALTGEGAEVVADNQDNIFPVFILTEVPVGLTGLVVAGIFAAAISSLTSILAALAQTTLSGLYLPLRKINPDAPMDAARNRELLLVSRGLIALWGVALCLMAFATAAYVEGQREAGNEVFFLDLALGLASYVIGSLLAAFLLAWLPLKVNAWGLIWSAPLSVFTVFASRFHDPGHGLLLAGVSGVLLITWIIFAAVGRSDLVGRRLARTGWLILGCGLMMLVWWQLWFAQIDPETGTVIMAEGTTEPAKFPIAWPWYAPIGGFMAFTFGYLLADRRDPDAVAAIPLDAEQPVGPAPVGAATPASA